MVVVHSNIIVAWNVITTASNVRVTALDNVSMAEKGIPMINRSFVIFSDERHLP